MRRLQEATLSPFIFPAAKFGKKVESQTFLEKGVQAHMLSLLASADLTVTDKTGGKTRNKGSIFAALEQITVTQGEDFITWRGRALRYLNEMFSPSQRSAMVRVPSTDNLANTTYHLKEQCELYFALPFAVRRRDTAFIEPDPKSQTKVNFTTLAQPEAELISGATTVALGDITVEAIEEFDASNRKLPLYQLYVRQQEIGVDGAASNKQVDITVADDEVLIGILLEQNAGVVGEVGDILNGFRLRNGQYFIFGTDGMVDNDHYQRRLEGKWGGAVYDTAYTPLWLPFDAKLSNTFKGTKLQLLLDVQPTSDADATASTSKIYAHLILGKRDTTQYASGVRRVATNVPFGT